VHAYEDFVGVVARPSLGHREDDVAAAPVVRGDSRGDPRRWRAVP